MKSFLTRLRLGAEMRAARIRTSCGSWIGWITITGYIGFCIIACIP